MHKIVSGLIALAMVFASSTAHAGNRDYRWGVDNNHHSPYYGQTYRSHRHYDRNREHRHRRHNHGVNTGEAVAIGLGALIIGSIIADGQNRSKQSQYVCQDVIQQGYYDNPYVSGRKCWYERLSRKNSTLYMKKIVTIVG